MLVFPLFYSRAQEIFKQELQCSVMKLRVIFGDDPPPIPSHPLLCKPNACRKPLPELPCDPDGPNTSTPSKELEDELTPIKSKENCQFQTDKVIPTPAKQLPSSATKEITSTIKKQIPSTIKKSCSTSVTKHTYYAQVKQTPCIESKLPLTSDNVYLPNNIPVPSTDVKRLCYSTVKPPLTQSAKSDLKLKEPQFSEQKGKFAPFAPSRTLGTKIHIQLVKGNSFTSHAEV